jgi:hypothetical protein
MFSPGDQACQSFVLALAAMIRVRVTRQDQVEDPSALSVPPSRCGCGRQIHYIGIFDNRIEVGNRHRDARPCRCCTAPLGCRGLGWCSRCACHQSPSGAEQGPVGVQSYRKSRARHSLRPIPVGPDRPRVKAVHPGERGRLTDGHSAQPAVLTVAEPDRNVALVQLKAVKNAAVHIA